MVAETSPEAKIMTRLLLICLLLFSACADAALFSGQRVAAPAAGGDPYWSSVTLLANNDNAANGTTTFLEQSTGKTITRVGSSLAYTNSTAPTGMTTSVGNYDAGTNYQTLADDAGFDFGSGDFTVECMVRFTTITSLGFNTMLSHRSSGSTTKAWQFYIYSNVEIDFLYTTNGSTNTILAVTSSAISTNTWHHLAVSKTGSTLRFYLNGVQQGADQTLSGTIYDSAEVLNIGAVTSGTRGQTANARITKGVARYTSNFTPPPLPLPTN